MADSINMTTTNPEIASGGRLHLLGLPVELQTMIFDFAYQRSAGVKLVKLSTWYREQSSLRQQANHSDPTPPRQRPGTNISNFLISKQYFVASARSYARSERLDLSAYLLSAGASNMGILEAFTREILGDYHTFSIFSFASVQRAKLTVRLQSFEVDDDETVELPVLKRLLTMQDFARSPVVRMLDHVSGLMRFELVAEDLSSYNVTELQEAVWRANIQTLESAVRPKVAAAKTTDVRSGMDRSNEELSETPLYPGSRIVFESSKDTAVVPSNIGERRLDSIIDELADMSGLDRLHVGRTIHDLIGTDDTSKGNGGDQDSLHEGLPTRKSAADTEMICDNDQSETNSAATETSNYDANTEDGIFVSGDELKSMRATAQECKAGSKLAAQRLESMQETTAKDRESLAKLQAATQNELEQLKTMASELLKMKAQDKMSRSAKQSGSGIRLDGKILAATIALFLVWHLCCYL